MSKMKQAAVSLLLVLSLLGGTDGAGRCGILAEA